MEKPATSSVSGTGSRRLGDSGIEVAPLHVGTVAWGAKSFGYGKTYTRDDIEAAYRTFLNNGMNFFDTSDTYAGGSSEELIGELRRRDGRDIQVSTKYTPFKIYEPTRNFSAQDMRGEIDKSLRRLGLATVDLYILHYAVSARRMDAHLDELVRTAKSGKAKRIGVSNFNTSQLRYAFSYCKDQGVELVVNQIQYSLLYRHAEKNGMLKACEELGVSIQAILPLAEGVLAGKYRPSGTPYPRTLRILGRVFELDLNMERTSRSSIVTRLSKTPYILEREKLEPLMWVLDEIASSHGATVAQVSLNWLLMANPRVMPIVGAKNGRQAADNAAALTWQLSDKEFETISRAEETVRCATDA